MSSLKLLEPLLDEGIRTTNYFNGRILSAEDLRVDQAATRTRDTLLGQALGMGVVKGLKVSVLQAGGTAPILAITAGLALAEDGQVLELPSSVELELARVEVASNTSTSGPFVTCGTPSNAASPTGTGSYVLVMGPASGLEGKAPVSTLGGGQADVCCRSRNGVEGVTFNLIRISPTGLSANTPNLNRNLLAHYCFGTAKLIAESAKQALSSPETFEYNPLALEDKIPADQVPLAVLSWSSKGVDFVDLWAVRRPVVPALEAPWHLLTGGRRQAEALAMFHQFQDQLDALKAGSSPTKVTLKDNFRYLPPLGIVPLAQVTRDPTNNSSSTTAGFDQITFFSGVPTTDLITLPAAALRAIVLSALWFEPFDLKAVMQSESKPELTLIQLEGIPNYVIFTRPIGFQPVVVDEENEVPDDTGTVSTNNARVNVTLTAERGNLSAVTLEAAGREAAGRDSTKKSASNRTDEKAKVSYLSLGNSGSGSGTKRPEKDPLEGKVKVWAEDEVGGSHSGKLAHAFDAAGNKLQYSVAGLPAGRYRIMALVSGFELASKKVQLTAGQTLSLTFKLVAASAKPPRKPPAGKKVDLLKDRGISKLVVVDKPRWPYPPDEEWQDWDKVRPGEDTRDWLLDWGRYVADISPDVTVDPGDIFLAIDPEYDPAQVAVKPYAYVVFGETGASVPLLLVGEEQALGRTVTLSEAGLTGFDAATLSQLNDLGINSVDAFGAAWTGLISEALEVSAGAALSTLEVARQSSSALNHGLSGAVSMDNTVEKALREVGITSTSQLAKANATEISRHFVAAGVKVDSAYAQRLVENAKLKSATRTGG